ncbi:bacillithiol system redox-active protein YtxJ [Gorillibacterium sp. sgz5001074]|uniref:bacillithiol system redox-active protein YtxJ n=1 Tax=Gorillibacterium sp. sgz5001074 TaxID=3446695 RepID=UPI003F67AFA9
MAQVRELKDVKDWKMMLECSSGKPVMLLKHSTRCPVSAEAYDQFMKHAGKEAETDVEYALVLVVEHRPVSNSIAEDLGVRHESPQAILIRDGQAVWNDSHWRITAEMLKERIGALS